MVFFDGDLGMGKIIFSCGVMCGLGYEGVVKSLIYILVEFYEYLSLFVYYFDLYWLGDLDELEYMGICDYFFGQSLCLIEWLEWGKGVLLELDFEIYFEWEGDGCLVVM